MDDLVAWYRAQLDDEERVIAGSGELGWLTFQTPDGSMDHTEAASRAGDGTWIVAGSERTGYASAVVVHREAQQRREIDAKRQRLSWIESALADDETDETARWLLALDALPFADRPGYREEWRP